MKVVMLHKPGDMEVVERVDRLPGQGEVVLQVEACSICGSDLEGYHGQHPKMTYPRVMGHEAASVVVEVGPGVTELRVGDRVAGTGQKGCEACQACWAGRTDQCENPAGGGFARDGAYAERMVVLPGGLVSVPEEISFEEAAVAQPVAIAYHAVAGRAVVQEGEAVLVQGCGPIGLAAMMLCKLRGARVMSTDIVDYRCRRARELGADLAVDVRDEDAPGTIREWTEGLGVDKVIECVGGDQDETLPQAVQVVADGGLVVVVGSFAHDRATIPIIDFKFSEKRIIGSQGMPEGYGPVFDLIGSGELDVEPLITHRLPLEEAYRGLQLMDTKAEEVMKVVLFPQGGYSDGS